MTSVTNINKIMDGIDYGYIDVQGHKLFNSDNNFLNSYRLQSPEQILINKIGVCFDQVELERYLFNKLGVNTESYFIIYYDSGKSPTHTYVVYEEANLFYWYEHSWEIYRGLHCYKSLNELHEDVRTKFQLHVLSEGIKSIDEDNFRLYKYKQPKYGISCLEFYQHCENGELLY